MICNFCGGSIPSPIHIEKCSETGPSKDEWIAIANGEREAVNRTKTFYQKQREQIMFWQGKFFAVKHENNKLRKKLRSLEAELQFLRVNNELPD